MPASELSERSKKFDFVILFRRPERVHPQHHFGPVVGVGAAIACVDRENRMATVVRAVEQRFEFQRFEFAFDRLDLGANFIFDRGVLFGHFDQRFDVFVFAGDFEQGRDDGFKRFEAPDRFLSRF